MENIINKSSIDELVNMYFKEAGEYEECTSFSLFMTLCHVIYRSQRANFQYWWNSLTKHEKEKIDTLRDRINILVSEKYYNVDQVFKNVELYDEAKDYEIPILDNKLLNILNKLYSIKYGFEIGSICKSICESKMLNVEEIDYLKSIGMKKIDEIKKVAHREAFKGTKFYILYKSRLLPIFSNNENVQFIDILESIWPFVRGQVCSVEKLNFCGWKSNIPIIKIN